MKKRIALIIIFIAMVFSSVRIVALEQTKADLKRDRVELSHIKYGLFNVDEWKSIIAEIITKKINELKITKENRPAMKRKIEGLLYGVVDQIEAGIKQGGTRSISGFFKSFISSIVGVSSQMRAQVPQYADQVIDLLNDPKNRKELKGYLIRQFNEMADKTVGQVDYTEYNAILAKYAAPSKEACLQRIAENTDQVKSQEHIYFIALALACCMLAALILIGRQYGPPELLTMAACAAVLLITGLALPMIDIEATIASFSFTLVGEPVVFKDQVLFFQSKSILQVVRLLITNGGFGLVLVAFLVFTFSVLIPFAKLIASIITIHQNVPPTNALHKFLVFKSSKWSMADVMVVAIFMSYIGFNGVINSQLTQITAFSSNVQVFTTNNSVLQTGFYLFAAYCVTGLLLSAMVDRRVGGREQVGRG